MSKTIWNAIVSISSNRRQRVDRCTSASCRFFSSLFSCQQKGPCCVMYLQNAFLMSG